MSYNSIFNILTTSNVQLKYSLLPITRAFELSGEGILADTTITCILTERTDTFCVPKDQETKEIDTKDNKTLQNYNAAQFF